MLLMVIEMTTILAAGVWKLSSQLSVSVKSASKRISTWMASPNHSSIVMSQVIYEKSA